MIIRLYSKKGKRGRSYIKSPDITRYCEVSLSYPYHPEFLEDLKNFLSKYYTLEEQNHKTKKGTGSVGRAFRDIQRRKEDEEYVNKKRKYQSIYRKTSPKPKENVDKWKARLSEYKNNRCDVCNKLLDYRTTTSKCREHNKGRPNKK